MLGNIHWYLVFVVIVVQDALVASTLSVVVFDPLFFLHSNAANADWLMLTYKR